MTDQTLKRDRLLATLDGPGWQLGVLTAPSGFGKTTLLRSWTTEVKASTSVAWVSLGADSGGVDAFWHRVATTARRLGQLRDHDLAMPIDACADPVPVVGRYFEGAGPSVLVLDAYENLRAATDDIDAALLRLIGLAPDLRIVLTTRGRTALAGRAAALDPRILRLTERDLAFTPAETRAFLGPLVAEEERDRTAERTQAETRGYPLAIRAIRLAMAREDALPTHDHADWRGLVAGYLEQQLAGSPAHEFVRRTSVPPYVDLALAEQLGGPEAAALLADLEWNGFGRWIPYARGRSVFQYVESVRDVFLADLRATDPATFARLSSLSASWLQANDEQELALSAAIDAEDFALAERIYRTVVVTIPESYTTDRLGAQLSRIPRAVLLRFPVLSFAYGLAQLSNVGTRAGAPEALRTAAQHIVTRQAGLTSAEVVLHHAIKTGSLRWTGRFAESARAADAGYAHYRSLDTAQRDALNELGPMTLRHLAYSFFQVGRVDLAREIVDEAISTADSPWSRNFTLVYGVGLRALEGRTPEARATAELVDPTMWPRDHAHSYLNALGRVGEATLLLDRFDLDGALARFDGCESFLHTAEFWPLINWVLAHARLGLGAAGTETHRLDEALAAAVPPPGIGDSLGTAALLNVLAIAWFSSGHREQALRVLGTRQSCAGQLAPAEVLARVTAGNPDEVLRDLPLLEGLRGHTIRSTMATLTLAASAALHVGSSDVAASLLRRSAALHDAHGARLHLIYLSSDDLAALRDFASGLGEPGPIAYLKDPVPSVIAHWRLVEPAAALSRREHIVLEALLRRQTRAEIAEALHVSEHTVKSQLRSIYRKLGVGSREAAIERAITLGLFQDRGVRR